MLVLAIAAAISLIDGSSPAPTALGTSVRARTLPDPVRPAFTPGPARPLPAGQRVWHFAPVRRSVGARSAPGAAGHVVALLETDTPEDTTNIVLVTAQRRVVDERLWLQVRLPALPSTPTGWVPRDALGGYGTVTTHLVIDLDRLTASLLDRGRTVLRARVGVGQPAWPTPTGDFYIRNRLTRYASPAYGPLAFGTSARSPTLTDWPAGGFIGIHGTDRPDLLPGRVSHGCIRLRNEDIVELGRRMPIGTPVTIRSGTAG